MKRSRGKVQVRHIIMDLCKSAMDVEKYIQIAKEIENIDLALVVNNAGIAYDKEVRIQNPE